MTPYTPQNFDRLYGTAGFSDTLLGNHFTLYQGYVTNVNKIMEMLKTQEPTSPQYAELKRRFGWEFSGMRLHELYFSNMTKDSQSMEVNSPLGQKIAADFGSVDDWMRDFKATGAMRGIGWAILYQDGQTGNLFNVWINEHEIGHLAGGTPLLVLDVFEHAYVTDYGIKRADYIEAFAGAVNWKEVLNRFQS
jgi:Fe-Mn family superoxide dismutase